jgi:UDP-N-acetylmuramate--alanine ligase
MMMFEKNSRFFFIGIGGSGMFPLARLLKKNGFSVGGSDQKKSPYTQKLEQLGIPIFAIHAKENIETYDIIVYSSAVSIKNPELKEAQEKKKKILHRSDLLKHFVNNHPSVTVVGTHGKTTSTSLVEEALNSSPHEKSSIAIVGGTNLSSQNYSDLKNCRFFIAEADESDGSFLKYEPDITLITNIEKDHLDYFKNFDAILHHFEKHISKLKGLKILVYNNDEPSCATLARRYPGEKISFGFTKEASIHATNLEPKGKNTHFTLRTPVNSYKVTLPLLGEHNVMNALGAFSVAYALKQDLSHVCIAFEKLLGIKRRLELIYQRDNCYFYDDYAHNPGKIDACLSALRKHFPDYKLIALFEPHRFSRIRFLFDEFVQAFHHADFTFVFPFFCAGETPSQEDRTIEDLAREINFYCHKPAEAVYNGKEDYPKVLKEMTEKSIVVSLGAGDISTIAYQIRELLTCETSLFQKTL